MHYFLHYNAYMYKYMHYIQSLEKISSALLEKYKSFNKMMCRASDLIQFCIL